MTENVEPAKRVSPITWIGLFVALFGMLIVRQAVNHFWVVIDLRSHWMAAIG